ncbi:MAG: Mur ligase family protein, partial [Clostridiales bacterium]
MDYHQSVEFLEELSRFGINLGLERIEELLSRLGNPHKQGMKIIHVAGTNGKGSTSAMLESILRCHYKTGLFTSPHLHSVRERFRINGRSISEEKLAQLITEMVPYWQQMQDDGFEAPTEFEMHTALALKYFADEKVDYAVLEAGLGGDYDSTKAADGNMAIITNISLDHMEYLGDNFHDIAKSKSGIINENATVLTGAYAGSLDIIRHKAEEKHASVEALGEELKYRHVMDVATKGQYFSLRTPRNKYESLYIPLLGRHQIANASLSVAMAELLGMDKESIAKGLARVCWPGRLELIGRKPMILLDGAHNYRGM